MQRNKILGTLYGAAHGDSLGAITEFCTREEIQKAFASGCKEYTASISQITKGIQPGSVTDDFGSSCYMMRAVLRHNGNFNREIAKEAVLEWSKDEEVFEKYAGQNTKSAMERLRIGITIDEESRKRHFNRQNTNGGAMKAAPMGLLARGDIDKAITYAMDLCWPTHYNSASTAAACAIACAVCEAQKENVTLEDIFEKAIYGARVSRILLEEADFKAYGPYVDVKIQEAINIGKTATTPEDVIELLNASIGTGIWVQESIPAVFAIIAACHGDYQTSLHCAVNAGGDTDTIASMTCAILGGYHGISCIPESTITFLQQSNTKLQMMETIEEYTNLLSK